MGALRDAAASSETEASLASAAARIEALPEQGGRGGGGERRAGAGGRAGAAGD